MAYGYYTEGVWLDAYDFDVSGDSSWAADFEERIRETISLQDSTPRLHLACANSFSVSADLQRWPQNLRKVDVNNTFPSGLPAIEFRCYDFADGLRPDLALIRLRLHGFDIYGNQSSPIQVSFSTGQPHQVSLPVSFATPVDVNRGFRYKRTEITQSGMITEDPSWTTANYCEGVINVSSDMEIAPISHRSLDIETQPELFADWGVERLEVLIHYERDGKSLSEVLSFESGVEPAIQTLSLAYHKRTGYQVYARWTLSEGQQKTIPYSEAEDDYYFMTY